MQRLGGGSYTRRNKKGGFVGGFGPTNPSCGCDMQAGWPKFLTENIPMPSGQRGGGTCGAPPIPNYYQGGGSMATTSQRGGSCAACSGLPLSGGGQPAAYNSNPVPDACPFPGTGYCGFYARGGAAERQATPEEAYQAERQAAQKEADGVERQATPEEADERLRKIVMNLRAAGKPLTARTLREYVNQKASEELQRERQRQRQSLVQVNAPAAADPSNSGAIEQQGGANYGEPMNLQARLRGGGCGCNAWKGGYKPTKKNRAALKKWRKGQSIGFTMTSSLKAKGLIPRTSRKNKGKKVVSAKYK